MRSHPSSGVGRTRQLLDRISAALDVPAAVFFEDAPEAVAARAGHTTPVLQLMLLIQLFNRIEDPDVREECLEFVRKRAAA